MAEDAAGADEGVETQTATTDPARRTVALSVRSLVAGAVLVVLAAALAVMTWLYVGQRSLVAAQRHDADNRAHAEQLALDYAVNAAAMSFQDLPAWKGRLVSGTTPELKEKLGKAANSMEQLLLPLQWTSTAKPLVAKVRSDDGGIYVVDTFVSVLTKTTQSPDNVQSTATYSITIDSNKDWLISDVGGIGAVMSGR